jgi:hypothetical protein
MTRSVLLDTQLMVLLTVGLTSASIIAKHKNLTELTRDDFALLLFLLGREPRLILLAQHGVGGGQPVAASP